MTSSHRLLLLLVAGAPALAASQTATFEVVGGQPSFSDQHYAWAVSDDGSVVAGQCNLKSGTKPSNGFRWTSSAFDVIGDLPGNPVYSIAVSVSGNGLFVGGISAANAVNNQPAVRWSKATGLQSLGLLASSTQATAFALSQDGNVGVGSCLLTNGQTRAFRWVQGSGMTAISTTASEARGVSSDGNVVAGYHLVNSQYVPFRWANGNLVSLSDLAGSKGGYGVGISRDGSVVVGASVVAQNPTRTLGWRWTQESGMASIGDLPGGAESSSAEGTNQDGSVIVGFGTGANGSEAFYWTKTLGLRSLKSILVDDYGLDLTGWQLRDAPSVSADGRTVVGWGIDKNGMGQAFRATLPGADMSLKVTLEDLLGSLGGEAYECQILTPGTETVLSTRKGACAEGGTFGFRVAPGSYDLKLRLKNTLWKRVNGVQVGSDPVTGVTAALITGDLDQDNTVSVFDYALISEAFDTQPGDPKWNVLADFDRDGSVTLFDYAQLSRNFDKSGD